MKTILKVSDHPNILGSIASGLCLVHCIATPLLFAAHAAHVQGHDSHPFWWGWIDLIFLTISFIAVFWSSRQVERQWSTYALWISWMLLTGIILNEKLSLFNIREEAIYIPSLALIVLHLYNKKYCRCKNNECCH